MRRAGELSSKAISAKIKTERVRTAMSTTTSTVRVEGADVVALRVPTLGWALRRTLLALVILSAFVGGTACLLYASIDPDEETAPAAKPASHAVPSNSTGHGPDYFTAPRKV
jgi:hypothetical protein